jgi:hypothetical protein
MFHIKEIEEIKVICTSQTLWPPSSSNDWIKNASNCMKGKISKLLAKTYFIRHGKKINPATNVQHDIYINDKKIEIKLSCLNNSKMFKWLQIRILDDFEYLLLFGIYPEEIKAWLLNRDDLKMLEDKNIIKPQQGGIRNNQSKITWLGINAFDIPDWLNCKEVHKILVNNPEKFI